MVSVWITRSTEFHVPLHSWNPLVIPRAVLLQIRGQLSAKGMHCLPFFKEHQEPQPADYSTGINIGNAQEQNAKWNIHNLYVIPRPKSQISQRIRWLHCCKSFLHLSHRGVVKANTVDWKTDFILIRINISCFKEYWNVYPWKQPLIMVIISTFVACALLWNTLVLIGWSSATCPYTGKLNQRFCLACWKLECCYPKSKWKVPQYGKADSLSEPRIWDLSRLSIICNNFVVNQTSLWQMVWQKKRYPLNLQNNCSLNLQKHPVS